MNKTMSAFKRSVNSTAIRSRIWGLILCGLLYIGMFPSNAKAQLLSQSPVYSQDFFLYTDEHGAPAIYGGDGFGLYQIVWVNITNWEYAGASFWPPYADDYYFYVRKEGDSEYETSDPAGPYTLQVRKHTDGNYEINDSNADLYRNVTINLGQSYTPNFVGGHSTGAYQTAYVNYTNWGDSNTFTPPARGTYTYWIRKVGDHNWNTTDPLGPFTLNVQ